MNPKNDPDETPTRFGGAKPPDRDPPPAEDRTVPSLGKAGTPPPPSPPKPARAANDALIGKQLGGCQIESLLGRGAMGAVYRARQTRLDRIVAVKVIRPEMMTDARTLKRFEVEARTVGKFNSAHVVMVHDVGFEQGVHFLVMEFVQGKNLRDHVKLLAGGRLPAAEAIPLLRQACKGLEEAQRLAVIHRDIKPDNLMLTDRGVLKIADFGIAKPAQDDFSLTMSSELIGTPLYMSPEQCQGINDLDFRSDMYSLGATFYYLLTGEPPVRASSVYELIQTKTKLENLCLWKALPELDENHPLSRVIERMTALDRDDRYESYEALLNDIVLVEQGSTIERLAKKSKPGALPKLVQPKPKKSAGMTMAVVGLLAVAAAGGGYWWSTRDTGERKESAVVGGGTLDAKVVRAQLANLRERFAQHGPSTALQQELASLAVEPTTRAERDQLQRDVEQGLAVAGRLAKLKAPAAQELPFTTLRDHFAAVDVAVKTDGTPGKELQSWLAQARGKARDERTLGAEAKSKLLGTFTQWQAERGRAADEAKRLQLREQLDGIETARRELLALLPELKGALDAELPLAAITGARTGLDDQAAPTADVDAGDALAGIAAELQAKGPLDSLRDSLDKLRVTRAEQRTERQRLVDAFQLANNCKLQVESTRTSKYPDVPKLPFHDIADYFVQLDRALAPLLVDGALPPWAANLRDKQRDEQVLQDKVLAVCRAAFEAWQRDSNAPNAAVAQLESSLASLTGGIAQATELFPAAKDALQQVVPVDALATARARLEQAQQRKEVLTAAPALLNDLDRVRSLADWRSERDKVQAGIDALQRKAAAFAGDSDVQSDLRRVVEQRDRWVKASQRVDEFVTRFVAGDLAGASSIADAGVLGSEGKDELRAFGAVVGKCADAFSVLDRELDVARAAALLDDGTALLRDHGGLAPAVVGRIEAWRQRLADLQRAAVAMVPVPAGSTRFGPVGAFFVGCTEVSQGEYQRFLDELDVLVGVLSGDEQKAKLATRLGDLELPADQLQRMLNRRGKLPSADLPVDFTTWYEAAAYARWYGMDLPSKAEWTLAAFGPDKQYAYPWGNDWKPIDEYRNIGGDLVPVERGARSWRSSNGKVVHHLAGNAAEWLQRESGATAALLAGGRCQDTQTEQKRRATGDDFHEASLTKALVGFGFRVILRPRQFLGSDFPSGRLPTTGR